MVDLTANNLQDIRKKLEKIGLPESLLPAVEQEAADTKTAYFYVGHNMELDKESVNLVLGFQDNRKGNFVPDLLGLSLKPDRQNVKDQNSFFLLPGDELTVKEAFNLMKGRAVHRPAGLEGEENYWMRLSKEKTWHGVAMPEMVNSRFSVERWMDGSGLDAVLSPEKRAAVISSLQAGDRVDLGTLLSRKEQALFLQANPEVNRVELQDQYRKLMDLKHFIPAHSVTAGRRRKMQ